jgi:DinB superfamily
MDHNLEHTVSLLARTPRALNVLLRDLPDFWTSRNEGEGSWSVFDIIGHLIHGERTDWIPRANIILQFGESKPFDRFDRLAQNRDSQGKSLPELLDEFARLRAENLERLGSLNLGPDSLCAAEDIRRSASSRCRSCWPPGRRTI